MPLTPRRCWGAGGCGRAGRRGGAMAAAAIEAAKNQKDLGWYKTGKVAKKPKLDDPVQLYSLCEVVSSEGTGPEAILTVKARPSKPNARTRARARAPRLRNQRLPSRPSLVPWPVAVAWGREGGGALSCVCVNEHPDFCEPTRARNRGLASWGWLTERGRRSSTPTTTSPSRTCPRAAGWAWARPSPSPARTSPRPTRRHR